MSSVGERLREERESRGTTLDAMAAATGIGRSYLEALEKDEILELPGKAFGKLYIRAYAEVLGFDPQPWIDDYDRERRLDFDGAAEPPAADPVRPGAAKAALAQWRESKLKERGDGEPEFEPDAEDEPVQAPRDTLPAAPPPPASRPFPLSRALLAAAGLLVVVAAVYFAAGRGGPVHPPAVERANSTPLIQAPAAPPPVTPPPTTPPPAAAPRPAKPSVADAAGSPLTVSEPGVGRRVVNSHLEGEADRFSEGARVCFSTRVHGGRRGDVIRHVWIYRGRTEQSIALTLAGPDFHTYSNKTVGHAGPWAVEARDAKGTVLARVEFNCEPAGR
jgi:cytoskeleton protein RodZ